MLRKFMKNSVNFAEINIDEITSNSEEFRNFVFTPTSDAIEELKNRWNNKTLTENVENYLNGNIPEPLVNGFKAVLFRQLFTPNFEFRHFLELINLATIDPVFWEYYDDKFTSNNPIKHALGKMRFQSEINKQTNLCKNIIDFNACDGKKIKDLKTAWGESLIDFHHSLIESEFCNSKFFFDASDWFHHTGENAKGYYSKYLYLFLRNGILYENFLLEGHELIFVKEVFLPAFIKVWESSGYKPLIVELLPFDSQGNDYWLSYPIRMTDCIKTENKV